MREGESISEIDREIDKQTEKKTVEGSQLMKEEGMK